MQWASVVLVLCSLAGVYCAPDQWEWSSAPGQWKTPDQWEKGMACCTPDQWEGTQATTSGYAGIFHHGLIREYNRVAYDFGGKRSAVFMTYINGDVEAKFQVVVRYEDGDKGGMLYVDNLSKHRCWKKKLEGEFRKACIPKDAHAYGDYYLGLEGGFKVSSYRIEGKRMTCVVTVQTVEKNVCAPVGEQALGRVAHYDVYRNTGFIDITPGIKNETVFDVPEDCSENWEEFEKDIPLELGREGYILGV